MEPRERSASRWKRRAGLVEELDTQRHQRTGAAVVGGAPACADEHGARARVQRRTKQLAGAVRRGEQRIAFAGRQPPQPRRRGHLHHRLPFLEQARRRPPPAGRADRRR